jgi:hypothetical protein
MPHREIRDRSVVSAFVHPPFLSTSRLDQLLRLTFSRLRDLQGLLGPILVYIQSPTYNFGQIFATARIGLVISQPPVVPVLTYVPTSTRFEIQITSPSLLSLLTLRYFPISSSAPNPPHFPPCFPPQFQPPHLPHSPRLPSITLPKENGTTRNPHSLLRHHHRLPHQPRPFPRRPPPCLGCLRRGTRKSVLRCV